MKSIKIVRLLERWHRRIPQNRVKLRLRSRFRDIRSQADQHLHPPRPRIIQKRCASVLCSRHHKGLQCKRHKYLRGVGHLQAGKLSHTHAYHRHRNTIQRNLRSNHRWRSRKSLRPISFRDHSHRSAIRVISRNKCPSQSSPHTQRLKCIPADHLSTYQFRLAINSRRNIYILERDEVAESIAPFPQFFQNGIRKRIACQPARIICSRGRDTAYAVPPAQIRTGGFPASGSCLRW